jgi:hypothetical protein
MRSMPAIDVPPNFMTMRGKKIPVLAVEAPSC